MQVAISSLEFQSKHPAKLALTLTFQVHVAEYLNLRVSHALLVINGLLHEVLRIVLVNQLLLTISSRAFVGHSQSQLT